MPKLDLRRPFGPTFLRGRISRHVSGSIPAYSFTRKEAAEIVQAAYREVADG